MRRGGDSSNIPLHPMEMATGTTTRQTQRLMREARQQHFNEGLCFHCHGRGHIGKKCPKKNQISNEQNLSQEKKRQCLEEGQCFSCQEQGHTNRRCPNRNPRDQAEDKQDGILGGEGTTNLGPWQYLEDLEQSPWTEKISLESNATTKTQDWLVKISIAQNH